MMITNERAPFIYFQKYPSIIINIAFGGGQQHTQRRR